MYYIRVEQRFENEGKWVTQRLQSDTLLLQQNAIASEYSTYGLLFGVDNIMYEQAFMMPIAYSQSHNGAERSTEARRHHANKPSCGQQQV